MDPPGTSRAELNTPGPGTPLTEASMVLSTLGGQPKALSDTEVMLYMDESKTGTPPPSSRMRRGERESVRGAFFVSQTSTVTEAASDDIDDLDNELPRVTHPFQDNLVTPVNRSQILMIRSNYFVSVKPGLI
ncbi:unnamed protein product [Diabrotica balteata]|uniref:Uncharacterized protein n=1 Tax=Diabrotica balteata TaxID=107213 RepID=A0A9N9XC93_DIABA|nr:unnamed protein product [Diabrotica balteata]